MAITILLLTPVIVCLIALFQSTSFFWYMVLCCGLHWFAIGLFKEGESRDGGYGGVASILICILALLSLGSKETGLFMLLAAISFVASLIYLGMEDDSSASTSPVSTPNRRHRNTEVWEVRKVRRISKH